MEPPSSHAEVAPSSPASGIAGDQGDQEVKDMIHKFAKFVAKNGPEFESMTKQKQADNPRFAFLYGGPLFAYYQSKLDSEREQINKEQF